LAGRLPIRQILLLRTRLLALELGVLLLGIVRIILILVHFLLLLKAEAVWGLLAFEVSSPLLLLWSFVVSMVHVRPPHVPLLAVAAWHHLVAHILVHFVVAALVEPLWHLLVLLRLIPLEAILVLRLEILRVTSSVLLGVHELLLLLGVLLVVITAAATILLLLAVLVELTVELLMAGLIVVAGSPPPLLRR